MATNPKPELDFSAIAAELGNAALQQTIQNAESACQHERQRRELTNQSNITECKARLKVLSDERDDHRATLRRTVQPNEDTKHRRSYYITIAAILCFAGFSFAHLALAPFNFGWVVWAYAVALAVVGAVSTDLVLEKYGNKHVIGTLCVTALVTSLTGIVILATLRGDILILFLKTAVTGANGDAISPEDAAIFYQSSATKLRVFFGLLAVAMELATGLAIFEARRVNRDAEYIHKRLADIQEEMILLVARIVFLTNEPSAFEHEFWSNFYRGLLCAVQRNLAQSARIGGLLLLSALFAHRAIAQTPFVIVGLDLSKSEVTTNSYGPQEHDKDVEAVARVISHLPPRAEVSVVGITNDSFSRPLILLSGHIPSDHGPLELIDQVQIARDRLATQMRRTVRSVPPSFRTTDVLGFFVLAGQMLRDTPHTRRALVVYSDLRNSASPVNIENAKLVPLNSTLKTVERQHLIADLSGVDVYVYGVHGIGRDVPYWDSLRDFWREYFKRSGANLRAFSMMRDVPDLDHAPGSLPTGDQK